MKFIRSYPSADAGCYIEGSTSFGLISMYMVGLMKWVDKRRLGAVENPRSDDWAEMEK